jgi:hypothetical protein
MSKLHLENRLQQGNDNRPIIRNRFGSDDGLSCSGILVKTLCMNNDRQQDSNSRLVNDSPLASNNGLPFSEFRRNLCMCK